MVSKKITSKAWVLGLGLLSLAAISGTSLAGTHVNVDIGYGPGWGWHHHPHYGYNNGCYWHPGRCYGPPSPPYYQPYYAHWHYSWHSGYYDPWGRWHPGYWTRWWG